MIVGLTGGIGSGKSTVAQMFNELGVPIYDSDKEAKNLMNDDAKVKKAIISLFGKMAYEGGKLNRTFLASKVFYDKKLLEKLNKIVHPAVRAHFEKWVENQDSPYVIQETALIFENQMQASYHRIILVTAPLELRINRVVQRDDVAKEAVLSRMENQLSDEEKIPKSDFLVENVDLTLTKERVVEIHQLLLNQVG
ncbi:dephospho-CoA kinase [Croceivirga thetidis]|uniref:Dephospho-CoA kinase n=1 Tax=Croceivirga thetidis TaxID=2721623 RepID=A0ABX1GSG9_9FLAO|nr:dephospho-CoA kinase [Croceivirga thetidis]NKI32554.1 dephospho-CoA kinase [Croceivirga thetidis]